LQEATPVRDVEIHQAAWSLKSGTDYDGALTYIHKVKNGRDIYFFSNSSPRSVDATVTLRGANDLSIWNPHSGAREEQTRAQHSNIRGNPVTTIRLSLAPFTSIFYVQKPPLEGAD
jgi:hypothetical protein